MIEEYVETWEEKKKEIENQIRKQDGGDWLTGLSYCSLVKLIVDNVFCEYDSNNITEIDNGDYQGTLIYIVPRDTYQPDTTEYIWTSIYYGSCCCCDTLQAIYEEEGEQRIKDYMKLCLDIFQGFHYLVDRR